ncbi:MAG: Hsp33 family molecular chaperone HslO [Oscillospiraceae bacterium]|nr:Hsp33 family molecular chaperone HslO [Oscillospiraceae bacterium]
MDKIVRATAAGGTVKIAAITSRGICERARQIHNLSPLGTAALGRTLSAASMMGNMLKAEKGSVSLQINGSGPLGMIFAVSDCDGNPRGYVRNGQIDLPLRDDGKIDVGSGVGEGLLTVIKDLGLKEPYVGSVELLGGEIAEDLALYFTESEQIPSAVALGVLVERDRTVRAAGGYIIQLMPGAEDSLIDKIESAVIRNGAVTKMLDAGMTPEDIINALLGELDVHILEEQEVEYRCTCSRERLSAALVSLGREELTKIRQEQGGAEMTCRFCDNIYNFTPEDIDALLADM